jgi:hypothetical protein
MRERRYGRFHFRRPQAKKQGISHPKTHTGFRGRKRAAVSKTVALMWGDIQDIFLFGCPKTIDITGFFKKFCIAIRTKPI